MKQRRKRRSGNNVGNAEVWGRDSEGEGKGMGDEVGRGWVGYILGL